MVEDSLATPPHQVLSRTSRAWPRTTEEARTTMWWRRDDRSAVSVTATVVRRGRAAGRSPSRCPSEFLISLSFFLLFLFYFFFFFSLLFLPPFISPRSVLRGGLSNSPQGRRRWRRFLAHARVRDVRTIVRKARVRNVRPRVASVKGKREQFRLGLRETDPPSFANRHEVVRDRVLRFELVSLDGLHSGVPTRTTPTLTPTTLRSIEQTFLELTSESASHSREAGFVPPLVEPSQPTPAQTQNTTAVHLPAPTTTLVEPQQQTQPQQQQQQHQQQQQQPVRRNMGGRRPTRTIGMTPEEEERRQIRRERNKMAAARCRKRRMDHTNALLEETEGLEQKKQSLQDEIEQLKQVKDELEFILDAHRAVCRRSLRPSSPLDIKPVIKNDLSIENQYAAESVKGDTTVAATTRPNRPNSLPVGLDNNNRLNSLTMFAEPKERPDTLAFKTVETPSFMKPSLDVAGMPITTPTSGIPFNFESLMEGGTGLTPVSTPLIPSCSTQQRSNLSAVDLSSPDANPPKLVSL